MKITIQAGTNTYLIAGNTTPVDGIGTYQGRLLNELKISRRFSKAGSAPLTLNISIRNNDGFIPRAINLWAAVTTVVSDTGYRWVGKITAYDRNESETLNIVATERSAPELSIQFPDEIAGVVTIDENYHQSTLKLTLPLVVGGTADQPILIKGILVNKSLGIYYLCVGEIHQVVKVYRGDKEITTGFSSFTGSAGQTNYAGFAYVQVTDEALHKNDDGTYSEISAEVIGLKLGSHSIEECRNGARFLQYLLTTPKDGICGWGLGISSSEINSTAFATAISRVDAAGLKMDGVFYFKQIAQSWIDQICQAIRGDYEIGENGQRRLFINANTASVKTYTKNNIRLLRDGKGSYSGQVYNEGRLEFDYNPLTGIFMQSAQFEDPDSIDDIEEQQFLGQSYLIRDMGTAQAILEYTCKKSIIGADKVHFETLELPDNAKKGDIITIDYPEKGLTGTWQIFALDIGDFKHSIEAEKFSSNIFIVGSPGVRIDWPIEIPITSTVNPGAASELLLSSEVRPSPDGTNLVVLKGTFSPPTGGYLAASIEYAQGILPILSWTDFGMLRGNSFEIPGVEPGQPYAIRIRMVSANGKSDYITATLTVQGDDIPPGTPEITVSSYLRTVTIKCVLSPYPEDMAGFEIFRHTSNNSAAAASIGKIDAAKGVANFLDTETAYGMTYYYWTKAYDTWNNPSGFSTVQSAFITFVQTADLADQILSESRLFAQGVVDAAALSNAALKQAGGAVAAWSAKGCTTASISEAGGVVDTTGNGNNGISDGATVIDTDIGKAFNFDGANDTLQFPAAPFRSAPAFTVLMRIKTAGLAPEMTLNGYWSNQYLPVAHSYSDGKMLFLVKNGANEVVSITDPQSHFDNEWHTFAFVADGLTIKMYRDGALTVSTSCIGLTWGDWSNNFSIGRNNNHSQYYGRFACFNFRHYNRALSASEVKAYHMFPDDAVFARIAADFIGAYEIASRHIASDSVVARILAAGAVTMEKLLIGAPGAALNDDPGFLDASAWETMDGHAAFSGWTLASVSDGKVGTGVMRGNGATTPNSNAFIQVRYIPIDPTKTYRLHAIARKRDAATNGEIYLSVREYDSAKIALSENAGHYVINAAAPETTWTEYNATIGPKGTFSFPVNTAFVRIGGLLDFNTTTGAGYEIQDFRIEECTPSTLIQDGAVLARHLTVEEAVISVGAQIANAVIGNAHIKDLHGGKITAGTLAITGLDSSAQSIINTAHSNAGTALANAATAQASADNAASAAVAAQATANNSAAAASNAQTSANTANSLLADIAADNKLTPHEKQGVRQEWDIIAAEKASMNSQASAFGIVAENTTYNAAFQALATYLNNDITWSDSVPSWISDANLGATSTITGSTFRSTWKAYYDARTALLNAISAKAKTLADAAQTTANSANLAAGAAQSTASSANATILAWCWQNNTTYIDGASIFTGTITAREINAAAFKRTTDFISLPAKGATTSSISLTGGIKDVSGNGRHGTASGGLQVVASDKGKAFYFDGVDDKIEGLSTLLTGSVAGSQVAFSMWIYPERNTAYLLGRPKFNANFGQFSLIISSGELKLVINATDGSGTHVYNMGTIPINLWSHVVVGHEFGDGAKTRGYINGIAVGSWVTGSGNGIASVDNTALEIGHWFGTPVSTDDLYWFKGYIWGFRALNYVPDAAEAKTLFMFADDGEAGTVSADRVNTGQLKSMNYSATAGSMLDLNDGAFNFGGSDDPLLALDASGLRVKGDISGSTGKFMGRVSSGYTIYNAASMGFNASFVNQGALLLMVGNLYYTLSTGVPYQIYVRLFAEGAIIELVIAGQLANGNGSTITVYKKRILGTYSKELKVVCRTDVPGISGYPLYIQIGGLTDYLIGKYTITEIFSVWGESATLQQVTSLPGTARNSIDFVV